jgi:hypothetical protein
VRTGKGFRNPLRIVAILVICTVPLHAQGQPDSAKLKADAQKIASPIRGDKAKAETYCQFDSLSEQIDEAARAKEQQSFVTYAAERIRASNTPFSFSVPAKPLQRAVVEDFLRKFARGHCAVEAKQF